MSNHSYFLFIDKEKDLTSQDVDIRIKKKFHYKKVGHLGTLDPFATGLLILATQEATKFLPLLKDDYKTYEARLFLGKETDSLDNTGQVVQEKAVPELSKEKIENVFATFLGKQKQEVPRYSAKHINGVRSYVLLREGIDFIPPTVDIEIKELSLLSFTRDTIDFRVTVSKGTYIRSLGRDIAYRLNTCGHLNRLRRIEVGPYSIKQCKTIDAITEEDFYPIEKMFPSIPVISLSGTLLKRVECGNEIRFSSSSPFIFFQKDKDLIALYEKKEKDIYHCYRGIRND